jgi:hypothetical protein
MWRKSGVFISEKLQPDAGSDAVQGGPMHPISSNHWQRGTSEGRGPTRPVSRKTRASGPAPCNGTDQIIRARVQKQSPK